MNVKLRDIESIGNTDVTDKIDETKPIEKTNEYKIEIKNKGLMSIRYVCIYIFYLNQRKRNYRY